MKKIIYIVIGLASIILFSSHKDKPCQDKEVDYLINRIDSVKNWYIIYAERNDTIFRIVSMKHPKEDCYKISIGERYNLSLKWQLANTLSPRGFKIIVQSSLGMVGGANFNPDTDVVLPDREGVAIGLYTTRDLQGLCLVE